ncbi:MAG TPA: DUF5615 family PIN-like protein [Pyrinomonadaceae bacterium]|nr:DUF5615 family PIN-like protein [Pyrinomonadaceae bacterium]
MRLLFDHNLSPKLIVTLADHFPGSEHVYRLGLGTASDPTIWEYARVNDLIIVTKDADFGDISVLRGFPPKVIWIRRGNCKTSAIGAILMENRDAIANLVSDAEAGMLTLH